MIELTDRGFVFEYPDEEERFYLTFAPPRQQSPAYRWVRGPHDLISTDLDMLLRGRALRFDVDACVRALVGDDSQIVVTRLEGTPYAFSIANSLRTLRFIHRPGQLPVYTLFDHSGAEEGISGDSLADVMMMASTSSSYHHHEPRRETAEEEANGLLLESLYDAYDDDATTGTKMHNGGGGETDRPADRLPIFIGTNGTVEHSSAYEFQNITDFDLSGIDGLDEFDIAHILES